MTGKGKQKHSQLSEARKARWNKKPNEIIEISDGSDNDSDIECTGWQGGVCHIISDSEDSSDGYITILSSDSEDDDLEDISGEAVIEGLQREWQMRQDLEQLALPTVAEKLMSYSNASLWRKAESNRSLGYNGLSERTKFRHNKQDRDKAAADKITRERWVVLNYLILQFNMS